MVLSRFRSHVVQLLRLMELTNPNTSRWRSGLPATIRLAAISLARTDEGVVVAVMSADLSERAAAAAMIRGWDWSALGARKCGATGWLTGNTTTPTRIAANVRFLSRGMDI